MRALILIVCLSVSCFGQDGKSLYDQAMNKLTGSGQNRSELAAADLMAKSSDAGYVPALVALGSMYETGLGLVGPNASKAADYYRKAAGQGSHLAEYLLGRMYYLGVYGTASRDGEKWLKLAADAGNPFASYLLGLSLYDRDPAAAIPRFRAAAEQGLPYAQYRLGKALIDYRMLPVKKYEAYVWLLVAANSGVSNAYSDLSLLESDLGSAQTDKAKLEAREWQAKVRRAVTAKGCTGWTGELDATPTPPPLDFQRYCE